MALPRANRLKSRNDFQAVFRKGIRCHSYCMTLRALSPRGKPREDTVCKQSHKADPIELAPIKIGISISTKVSKRAVVRNRLKRQIAAQLYKLLPDMSPGWRLVFVVKPGAIEPSCDRQQFLQELEQLLIKAEVINGYS